MKFKIGFLYYVLWVVPMWAMGILIWFWVGPALALFLFHDPRLVPIVAQMKNDWIGLGSMLAVATIFGLLAGWKIREGWYDNL